MVVASKDHERKATAWACATITLLSCDLIANADGSWHVETHLGWRTADDWRQLCQLARQIQAEHQRAIMKSASHDGGDLVLLR